MVLVGIMLATGIYLLSGMVYFLFRYDLRSLISKCLLLALFVIGTTLTATLYFFFVYRQAHPARSQAGSTG